MKSAIVTGGSGKAGKATIRELLARSFDVEVFTYWSTQSLFLHKLLERTRLRSDFGVEATGHRISP